MNHKKLYVRDWRLEQGDILLTVLVFAAIVLTVTIGLVNWGATMLKGIRNVKTNEQAFQIAEAGIDYYRWHLAQYPMDYSDGTTTPGPYYHSFYDKDNNLIGAYSLSITPPSIGSTKVVITSTATTTANPNAKRKIQVALAQPSLAQYAVVANYYMRFGIGTVVNGLVMSNKGIHFDGVSNNIVSSAMATDTDPDTGQTQWGVWTANSPSDPQPSTPVPTPDPHAGISFVGRQYPVSAFPFGSFIVNLSDLHKIANGGVVGGACTTSGGPCWKNSGSGYSGYYIHINTNNTYNIYKVKNLQTVSNCNSDGSPQWGIWSIKSPVTTASGNIVSITGNPFPIPANGVIFVEDDLWIDGTNIGQSVPTRVTIVAGETIDSQHMSSTTGSNITINNDVTYSQPYDGSDVVGLIAQGNLNVGLASDNDLQIDAALIAEGGRVGRYYYPSSCNLSDANGPYYARNSITLNGMVGTSFRYGFQWIATPVNSWNDPWDCGGIIGKIAGGYCTRNLNYDNNLLYSPPPNFPLASTQYQIISWKEVQ